MEYPEYGVPFIAQGCALGEGHIDVPWVIDYLAQNCPNAEGLHLVVENTWIPDDPKRDRDEYMRNVMRHGLDYLRQLVH